MLSRSAEGLYWMGRYLVRGEHLCNMLRVQIEALTDRPIPEIYFGWRRIYSSISRMPPLGGFEIGSDDYTLVDSFTLADDLTFERSNPDSIWSCLALAGENGRQMRHCISAEMWTRLNLAYLQIQKFNIADIWVGSTADFYAQSAAEINTLAGVAESTMYRDTGWSFMRLGRFIERAQLSTALLLAQISEVSPDDENPGSDWTSLLRVCYALDAYSSRYSVEVLPHQVMDLMVADPMLPASVSCAIDEVTREIASIGPGPDLTASEAVVDTGNRLAGLVRTEWHGEPDREGLIRQLSHHSRVLHDVVTAAYFNYSA